MKKSISEAVLIVAVIIFGGIFLYTGTTMVKQLEGVSGVEEDNMDDYYFDDYTSNAGVNNNSEMAIISTDDLSIGSIASSISYQQDKIEDSLNKDIDSEIETYVTDTEVVGLREAVLKEVSSTSSDYDITYYKIGNNNYIVGVTNDDGSFSNYEYSISTSIFGTKYNLVDVVSGDSTKVNSKLIESEKDRSFNYNVGYENSYISETEVNKSFSNNESLIEEVYEENKDKILILNTYTNDVISNSATGFFIAPGIVATSWSYINESLKDGTSIEGMDANYTGHKILGVVSINEESDIALLKLDDATGESVTTGTVSEGEEVLLLGSETGFGTTGKVGVNVVEGNSQVNSLNVSPTNVGSPLFNSSGEVVGMVTGTSVNNDLSYSISGDYLNEYISLYSNTNLKNVKYTPFNTLANKYYSYNISDENGITLKQEIIDKYLSIGNIVDDINAKLVECNDTNNGISLRYLNDSSVSSDIVISSFTNGLLDKGYNELLNSKIRKTYENSVYKINIYFELDYIIVVIKEK